MKTGRGIAKDKPNWLQLAADLVRMGCNKFDAEDIAKDATSYPNTLFRLRQLRDAYYDGAKYATRVSDAIGKVMLSFPHDEFARATEVKKGDERKEPRTDTSV